MKNKLGILILTVIFLVSMASLSPAQKGKKPPKPDEAPALYKVTITINPDGAGIATSTITHATEILTDSHHPTRECLLTFIKTR